MNIARDSLEFGSRYPRLSELIDLEKMRVDRRVFTDPQIYQLEIEMIWEKTWLFLAHESQVPNCFDYFRAYMGPHSVFLWRNAEGGLQCFANVCAHRGATICNSMHGNARSISCEFHGWSFDSFGRLLAMPKERNAAHHPDFSKEKFGLKSVPRLENYRGFIFASLNPSVPSLLDHLGDAKAMIDLFVDSAPHGIEILPGASTTRFKGNWKNQSENSLDGWHADVTHASYMMTQKNRTKRKDQMFMDGSLDLSAMYQDKSMESGFYNFKNGHASLWSDWPNLEQRPNYAQFLEFKKLYGEEKAKWLSGRFRNLLVYPGIYLIDHLSTQIRVFRPLSVDETEVTLYCVGHRGESPQSRNVRLRQYEDCFNAGGMITADDYIEFERCQAGYDNAGHQWNEFSRGFDRLQTETDAHGKALGIKAELCGSQFEDEGIYIGLWKEWLRLMTSD